MRDIDTNTEDEDSSNESAGINRNNNSKNYGNNGEALEEDTKFHHSCNVEKEVGKLVVKLGFAPEIAAFITCKDMAVELTDVARKINTGNENFYDTCLAASSFKPWSARLE